jgi:hypothetical protein
VSRFGKNVTRFGEDQKHWFDIKETCHHWQNVTRFGETLIQFLALQGENVSRFT